PYVKLISQLFGNRMVVANATGCSSIYGGSFPSLPYCQDKSGRGPAWANSLFEDNAEFGYGMRLAIDNNRAQLKGNVEAALAMDIDADLKKALEAAMTTWDSIDAAAIANQDAVKAALKKAKVCDGCKEVVAKIAELQDYFVDKSLWIIGGDGWAYDIGYGGLDHVVAQNRNVNILVLDTEVYSNTGGQASKSTPIGAVALFANGGKRLTKKNLGFMCMSYGNVFVASIDMGADRNQALQAIRAAEAYNGPSVIIAYSPCIAHGIKGDMRMSQVEAKRAYEAGYWPLYQYNPIDETPFKWQTKEATASFQDFIRSERRYASLQKTAPADAEALFAKAEEDNNRRMKFYKELGDILK
ncbi:MAG: thiamine pyrophosphate-dependent enzyme, partial [Victivallaceae bacterium]